MGMTVNTSDAVEYKGFRLHLESGWYVAYRSKKFKETDRKRGTGEPILTPQDHDRYPLGTGDLDEACRRLDNKLARKKPVREDNSKNYKLKL